MKKLIKESVNYLIEEISESKEGVKKIKLRILTEGLTLGKDKVYSRQALKEAAQEGIYNNIPMFLNHMSTDEEFNRPERDINDKVAQIKTFEYKESADVGYLLANAIVHGSPKYDSEAIFKWMKNMKDSNTPIELSQHAYIDGHEGKYNESQVLIVDKIVQAKSVDYVTAGNAGGFVEALESAGKNTNLEKGEETMTLKELKEKFPELVTKILEESKEAQKVIELETKITTLESESKVKDEKIIELELKEKKDGLMVEAKKLIADSKLPEPTQKRILELVEAETITAETISLKPAVEEMIKKEKGYLESLVDKNKKKIVFGHGEDEGETKESSEDVEGLLDGIQEAKETKK